MFELRSGGGSAWAREDGGSEEGVVAAEIENSISADFGALRI